MKALNEMNNSDRGFLLGSLFPEQREDIVRYIVLQIAVNTKHRDEIVRDWKGSIIQHTLWYTWIAEIERTARKEGKSLFKNARRFADQLFDGHRAMFTLHCLNGYARQEGCPPKLAQCIAFLFGTEMIVPVKFEYGN